MSFINFISNEFNSPYFRSHVVFKNALSDLPKTIHTKHKLGSQNSTPHVNSTKK